MEKLYENLDEQLRTQEVPDDDLRRFEHARLKRWIP